MGGFPLGLLDVLKSMLGIRPVSIGELNRHAIASPPKPSSQQAPPKDPLRDVEITDEFRTILALLEKKCPIVFVSGKAGTGKTTLIQVARETRSNVAVVAPTGVAALNAKGATIHSFFKFPPRIVTDEDLDQPRDRRLYSKLELLIIDEISMVRADVIDAVNKLLQRLGPHPEQPFGGVQLLLVGDLFQLPPVAPTAEWDVLSQIYDSPYFFSAKTLQSCSLVAIELTKIYRQRDMAFTELLNKIRVAEGVEDVVASLNAQVMMGAGGAGSAITLSCTNDVADQRNEEELRRLPGEIRTFTGIASGDFRVKDDKLPSPLQLTLKPGARVMFTKNDEQGRWVNGTLGVVRELGDSAIRVELLSDHPGETHDVGKATWEFFKYEYDPIEDRIKPVVTGRYVQFPLMLAWAVTIHKSQGKTLEKVHIDLGYGAFSPGQVYVALSRCRTLGDISLEKPIRAQEVKCDERIKRFFVSLAGLQKNPKA